MLEDFNFISGEFLKQYIKILHHFVLTKFGIIYSAFFVNPRLKRTAANYM